MWQKLKTEPSWRRSCLIMQRWNQGETRENGGKKWFFLLLSRLFPPFFFLFPHLSCLFQILSSSRRLSLTPRGFWELPHPLPSFFSLIAGKSQYFPLFYLSVTYFSWNSLFALLCVFSPIFSFSSSFFPFSPLFPLHFFLFYILFFLFPELNSSFLSSILSFLSSLLSFLSSLLS